MRTRCAAMAATRGRMAGLFAVTALCCATADLRAQEPGQSAEELLEEVLERLDEAENQIMELEDAQSSRPPVLAFDALNLDLGGFITQQFTVASGDENTDSTFNATQFEILMKADVTDRVSVFTALGFLREADIDLSTPDSPFFRNQANRVPLIIGWANYEHSDAIQLRVGRFVTPHGIINIEHFPPVLLELNQPMFLRPFPGSSIFPNFMNGAEIHGKQFVGADENQRIDYSIYAGFFSASSPDNLIGGARVAWTPDVGGLTIGANFSHGSRDIGAGPPGNLTNVPVGSLTKGSYNQYGLDVLVDSGSLLWKSEFFTSDEGNADTRIGAYTQPAWRFSDQWIGFYRFDYFDPGQGLSESTEHVIGVNYLPTSDVRVRADYRIKNFDVGDEDVHFFQLSATVSF